MYTEGGSRRDDLYPPHMNDRVSARLPVFQSMILAQVVWYVYNCSVEDDACDFPGVQYRDTSY